MIVEEPMGKKKSIALKCGLKAVVFFVSMVFNLGCPSALIQRFNALIAQKIYFIFFSLLSTQVPTMR